MSSRVAYSDIEIPTQTFTAAERLAMYQQIQITSALDVLTKVTEKLTDAATATELLTRLNIAPDRAKAMVTAAATREGISAGDRDFQREVLKQLLSVPAAREAVYNLTDVEDL